MKVVQINSTCEKGSTGKICVGISELLTKNGIDNYILYSVGATDYPKSIKYSNYKYIKLQAFKSHFFGNYGFNSGQSTSKVLAILERIKPDIVHLHNIHTHDCNLNILLSYFKKNHTKLIWTFHDCWAFTAYCPHFMMVGCDKWKTGCFDCPQIRKFSWIFDRSRELYNIKKDLLSGLELTIVTPSNWLADLVKQSFLKNYPVKVINNGIDLSIFKPTQSDCLSIYNIPDDKYVILGVAFDWGVRKGLDVFIELAKQLPEDKFQIILVGTNDKLDKQLPDNIISIHRTHSQKELAEIYSAADLFINPTREDTYPTVNMEAIACGTPVITFNTGGSPEILDRNCGVVVPCDDIDALVKEIHRICTENTFLQESCLHRAKAFDINCRFNDYLKLYKDIL